LSKSLQDQLIKAGLVSTKQVKQANASKSKKNRQERHQKTPIIDPTKLKIERKIAEKAERDLALNRQRELEKQRRELESQIKQLVDENLVPEDNEGQSFHFNHKGRIKKIYVSEPIRDQLIKGQLAIVFSEKRYRMVPVEVALKIKTRDELALILLQDASRSGENSDGDPEYAKYAVPDDLIW
jgi:uncharacterized protein